MLDVLGIQNGGIYGIVGIIGIFIIIWFLFRSFGSGRIDLERKEVQQDQELLNIDKKALAAAREQKKDAGVLIGLIEELRGRLLQLGFTESPERNGEYTFIVEGLGIIKAEGKGAIQDKSSLNKINNGITFYCSNLPNDDSINNLVRRIKDVQIKLFRSIINQITYYRERYGLLRKKAQETVAEAGERAA